MSVDPREKLETPSGATEAAPIESQHQMQPPRAMAAWAAATLAVGVVAWAMTRVIGLPDWVVPGSLGAMLAALLATAITMKVRPHVPWRRTWIGGAVAVVVFASFVVGFMVTRALGIGPAASLIGAGKLSDGERLIITDFKSPANDSILGLTITDALRWNLEQSTALHVVSRRSMNETLRLMQRPLNTVVNVDVGRELATRDGAKAVLDGDVASIGGRYVLSARLLSPNAGEELASFREEAASRDELIAAIGRLDKQLRSKVGESLKSVNDASPPERVATGSIAALSKYAAALRAFDQTGDYDRTAPLLDQAVAIDSTFALAWRRLASDFSVIGERDSAARAAAKAYAHRERLSETERGLTIGTYYAVGPAVDDERALDAFENVLARDSTNDVALDGASRILARRRDYDRAAIYSLRAAAQDKGISSPIPWQNAVTWSLPARGLATMDSIMRLWAARAPSEPTRLLFQARAATFGHRDYDGGEQNYAAIRPRIAASPALTDTALLDQSALMFLRGRLREGFQYRNDVRKRQAGRGERLAPLLAALDSAQVISRIEENGPQARAVLRRALSLTSLDSVAAVDRPYRQVLAAMASMGDTTGLAQTRADVQRTLVAEGKTIERPSVEAMADGQVELVAGRYGGAIQKFNEADRLRMPCVECVAASRFLAFDRLGQTDSAIAAGEAFLKVDHLTAPLNDALYRAGILQRLGELYEAKHVPYKAVQRYEEFVELWKRADPELQPRVREVRGRLDRLRAEIVRKG